MKHLSRYSISWIIIIGIALIGQNAFSQNDNIAYIYLSDSTNASSFKTLLESNGYSTDLIEKNDVISTGWSNYDLIIAGSETSFGYNWGDSASVAHIQNSERPVLGLGFGGQGLFEEFGLSINWVNGAVSSGTKIVCVDTTLTIFQAPNDIPIPPNSQIQLYSSPSQIGVEYGPSISPSVLLIGQDLNLSYYSIEAEQDKYWLWGFVDSPDNMTEIGRELFINIVSFMTNEIVGLEEGVSSKPESFSLAQNYPNPFNPTTVINYYLSSISNVELKIYNKLGQKIKTLVSSKQPIGFHQVQWDGRDNKGNLMSSGLYLYRLKAGSFVETHKMILIK